MKKAKAFRILSDLNHCPDCQDEFITVYYNIGSVMKDLRYCNGVNDAIDLIDNMPSMVDIALEFNDEFIE